MSWLSSHPWAQIALIVLAVALFIVASKPRTPEQYDAMWRPWATFCRACAALGPDVIKFAKILAESRQPAKTPEEMRRTAIKLAIAILTEEPPSAFDAPTAKTVTDPSTSTNDDDS